MSISEDSCTLTHSFPMHFFSTPWKHQKTVRFSDIFKGVEKGRIGNKWVNSDTLTNFSYGILVNGFQDPMKLPMWRPGATLPSTLPFDKLHIMRDSKTPVKQPPSLGDTNPPLHPLRTWPSKSTCQSYPDKSRSWRTFSDTKEKNLNNRNKNYKISHWHRRREQKIGWRKQINKNVLSMTF